MVRQGFRAWGPAVAGRACVRELVGRCRLRPEFANSGTRDFLVWAARQSPRQLTWMSKNGRNASGWGI